MEKNGHKIKIQRPHVALAIEKNRKFPLQNMKCRYTPDGIVVVNELMDRQKEKGIKIGQAQGKKTIKQGGALWCSHRPTVECLVMVKIGVCPNVT
jgi:hypothetical protein